MSGLVVQGLVKRYGDNPVVRGLDLSMGDGEIVSLLGPSGCGKTTALRLVAGLERPDGGAIHIGDRAVYGAGVDLPPEARGLGMVFQSYAVWPHRRVRENVGYPLELAGVADKSARVEEALRLVRLDGLGERFPSALSGGQQQRVALARALVARPSLLLCDEPLSNLDQKLREEMRHEIRQLARSLGITTLYVTHDQPEAFAVSDRIAVMMGGLIAQLDTPSALYGAPISLEVARFVGRLSVLAGARRSGEASTELGGQQVPTTFAPGAGDTPTLGVRPEDVSLGEGGLSGRVTRSTFLGERVELEVACDAGPVRFDVAHRTAPREGELVHLRIARARAF